MRQRRRVTFASPNVSNSSQDTHAQTLGLVAAAACHYMLSSNKYLNIKEPRKTQLRKENKEKKKSHKERKVHEKIEREVEQI